MRMFKDVCLSEIKMHKMHFSSVTLKKVRQQFTSATKICGHAMIDCLLMSIIEIIDEISSILYIYDNCIIV